MNPLKTKLVVPIEYIYANICGPMKTQVAGRENYYLLFQG